ncbi:hypothetical protein QTO34_010043 [Cnephaeus nilssonii]|uniref:Ig-like domain-containing protein n=1 Tax=Cnephaeus nilssonii TaxID=3371016 RepID=A0AA40HEM3_CNENI|nr:hypothetical protein QTO34_010043 [Eptesicus nilssonii]
MTSQPPHPPRPVEAKFPFQPGHSLSPRTSCWGVLGPAPELGTSLPDTGTWTRSAQPKVDMVPLLLLALLWGGSMQQQPGFKLEVQETFVAPYGNLYIYWYRDGDNLDYDAPVASSKPYGPVKEETRNRFLFINSRTNDCSLRITDARMSDTGRYFFRVERGDSVEHNFREKMLNLQVTGPGEFRALRYESHSGSHFGSPAPEAQAPPSLLFLPDRQTPHPDSGAAGVRPPHTADLQPARWLQRGRTFHLLLGGSRCGLTEPPEPQLLGAHLHPRPRDHGTTLTCQVKRERPPLTSQRTIRLNVSYAPQNLTIDVSFRNATALKILQTTSLPILEGQALRLLCVADSNPPAELSWFRGSPGLNATPISSTAILELPRVGPAQEGEFTCQARHPLGSPSVSLSLSVVCSPHSSRCVTEEQQGSWPLVLTLIRGALMGAGFLLTYVLTWLYYTRCGGPQNTRRAPDGSSLL